INTVLYKVFFRADKEISIDSGWAALPVRHHLRMKNIYLSFGRTACYLIIYGVCIAFDIQKCRTFWCAVAHRRNRYTGFIQLSGIPVARGSSYIVLMKRLMAHPAIFFTKKALFLKMGMC